MNEPYEGASSALAPKVAIPTVVSDVLLSSYSFLVFRSSPLLLLCTCISLSFSISVSVSFLIFFFFPTHSNGMGEGQRANDKRNSIGTQMWNRDETEKNLQARMMCLDVAKAIACGAETFTFTTLGNMIARRAYACRAPFRQ